MYRYVGNRYTSETDPSGLFWIQDSRWSAEGWSAWLNRTNHGAGLSAIPNTVVHLRDNHYQIAIAEAYREPLRRLLGGTGSANSARLTSSSTTSSTMRSPATFTSR